VDAPKVHVPVAQYAKNLTTMVQSCQKIGAKVVICTIPPINPDAYFKRHAKEKFDAAGGLDAILEQYRAAASKVAETHQPGLVDLAQTLNKRPEWLSDDGVHPTKEGSEILAQEIAKAVRPLLQHN
jgi:lysophospholipase L1-like esterase